ncbi:type I 3-dehydroquinate dehydratase [Anaerosacchariphilus polymeriproducens]|uniref:3-dehydroquinate dehydratase n=1 Tax=Anaerosacchariphilus polymeriproducens TaxID=1812858 RepID=A0A371B0F7_9FIRM|nr:type I 3-dehydroquinate dehydratase [Anaerosacchariphilus polymeriproducens]RDU25232.1 type I 3-dehydroquinate dehydratase [Anaerosacchariphilus polymeriproducens]
MRQAVKIKNIDIGVGMPKICVPIVGRTKEEILSQALVLKKENPDIVEFRVDWFEDTSDFEAVISVLKELSEVLVEFPILFTYRTKKEGGEKEIKYEDYYKLNLMAAQSGYIDLIDVELFANGIEQLLKELKKEKVCIVVSNHDFTKTPKKEEMLDRLQKMDRLGADILKIAVMPQNKKDVLTLLEVTYEMKELYTKKPIITMSMEKNGVISRITGEIFGSDITFGSVLKASAPGQIHIGQLKEILNHIHQVNK